MSPRQAVAHVQSHWLQLAPVARGVLWMLLAGLLFALMGVLVKTLGSRLDSFQVAFFRAGFGCVAILPFALAAGPKVLATRRFGAHLLRGTLGAAGMFSGFYSITHLPLAEATAYSFTKPLFLVLLAALFLGERVRARRIAATAIGFAGVLIMLRPEQLLAGGGLPVAALVGLAGAAFVAGIVVMVKRLLRTERPVTVMAYFGIISTLLTLAPALVVWVPPTPQELALLMAVGAFGASAQGCMIRAYNIAEATAIAPFDYFRLIYAAIFGFAFFAEVPALWTLAGAAVIVGSTLYIAHRETRLGRKAPGPAAPVEIAAATATGATSAAVAK